MTIIYRDATPADAAALDAIFDTVFCDTFAHLYRPQDLNAFLSSFGVRDWERQLNDPYVAQAKRDGFRSRAAYKLQEIDDKHRFLKPGQSVVDLGAAPGGWSQIAAKRVGSANGKGKVIAIDFSSAKRL